MPNSSDWLWRQNQLPSQDFKDQLLAELRPQSTKQSRNPINWGLGVSLSLASLAVVFLGLSQARRNTTEIDSVVLAEVINQDLPDAYQAQVYQIEALDRLLSDLEQL